MVRKALDKNRALLRTLRTLEDSPDSHGWHVEESKRNGSYNVASTFISTHT